MYCKKCGTELKENEKFCAKCGKGIGESTPRTIDSKKTAMVVVFILSIVVALSPFVKMYYINVFEQEDFSVSGIFESVSEVMAFGNDMGAEFHLSDIKFDEMSSESKTVFFIVVFDIILFVIGYAELLVEMIYIVSGKKDSEGKFWKAAISSLIALFIANLIIFAVIFMINASLNKELENYGADNASVKVIGVHASHYFFQILAVVAYIVAHIKYRDWKKNS